MNHKKILVIDDEASILQALEVALALKGYDVETTTDSARVDSLKEFPADLILMDMLLSGADGSDIVRSLKENESTRHIPVVMFSAHPSADQQSRACGADDFLPKPFGIYELLDAIERNLLNAHAR